MMQIVILQKYRYGTILCNELVWLFMFLNICCIQYSIARFGQMASLDNLIYYSLE